MSRARSIILLREGGRGGERERDGKRLGERHGERDRERKRERERDTEKHRKRETQKGIWQRDTLTPVRRRFLGVCLYLSVYFLARLRPHGINPQPHVPCT